jgi:hypothetical protein
MNEHAKADILEPIETLRGRLLNHLLNQWKDLSTVMKEIKTHPAFFLQ